MRLSTLRRHWDELGRTDPLWAALTSPQKKGNRWTVSEFLQTGQDEICAVMTYLDTRGLTVERARAIDFGCGAGRLTRALRHYFDEVVGIDIAPSMVALASELHRDAAGVRFIVNSSNRLDAITSESIDFVYSRLVLQHIHPRYVRQYLAEFIRVLRPGGVLLFQLPSDEIPPVVGHGLKSILPLKVVALIRAARRLARFPRMEVHGIARPEVEQLLVRAGAAIVDVTADRVHGADTPGFRYCVVKQAAPLPSSVFPR